MNGLFSARDKGAHKIPLSLNIAEPSFNSTEGIPGHQILRCKITYKSQMGMAPPGPETAVLNVDVLPPDRDEPMQMTVRGSFNTYVNFNFKVMRGEVQIGGHFDGYAQERIVRPYFPPENPQHDSGWQPAPPPPPNVLFHLSGSQIVDNKRVFPSTQWFTLPDNSLLDWYEQRNRVIVTGCGGQKLTYEFEAWKIET